MKPAIVDTIQFSILTALAWMFAIMGIGITTLLGLRRSAASHA